MEELFESERVRRLKDIEVRQLMEEDYGTQTERKELIDQREVLQNGLDTCREIATRPDLGPVRFTDTLSNSTIQAYSFTFTV
jgi:aryl carrier-like protein